MHSRLIPRLVPFASVAALVACGSLVGVEDVHPGAMAGAGGSAGGSAASGGKTDGGTAGNGGTDAAQGGAGSANGGNGGTTESSAGDSSFAGEGGVGAGGNGGAVGGGGSGGAVGGSGGALGGGGSGGATNSTTVKGHVIDYWGHKVPNVPVQIGDTRVTTDEGGAFTIDKVPAQYDVSLVVDFSSPREVYGWVYQGLTRRDPTLQVYAGLGSRSANIVVTPKDAVLVDNSTLTVSMGGPDGDKELTGVGENGVQTSASWRGPATTSERAHGLVWQRDANDLPSSYLAYDSTLVALADTPDTTAIDLNMKPGVPLVSGYVGGTVTPSSSTDRINRVFLHFSSNANMQLVNDSKGPNKFSYLVPTIPNSSITFAASEGHAGSGAFAVIHKDGLAAGNSAVTLTVPNPSKPLTPNSSAVDVDGSTPFSFTPGKGAAGGFVVAIISSDFYDGLYVVTANKNFKLPVVAGGAYAFVSARKYYWRVETHGDFANLDAMTSSTGFMDSFSANFDSPEGPRTGSGSYTISVSNTFTAK